MKKQPEYSIQNEEKQELFLENINKVNKSITRLIKKQ